MNLLPLALYFFAVLMTVGGMLVLSYLLGQRHAGRVTAEPYESGIRATGTARRRFHAKYYLVALLFVIFDLEAAILFAWAVAARQLGWFGYVGALIFIAILSIALVYEWRAGALDWAGRPRQVDVGDGTEAAAAGTRVEPGGGRDESEEGFRDTQKQETIQR